MFGYYSFCFLLGEADVTATPPFSRQQALSRNLKGCDSARCLYWRSLLHFGQSHRNGPKLAESDHFEESLGLIYTL